MRLPGNIRPCHSAANGARRDAYRRIVPHTLHFARGGVRENIKLFIFFREPDRRPDSRTRLPISG